MDKMIEIIYGHQREPSKLSTCEEYQRFRSQVPLKKIVVDEDSSKVWSIYDSGPRNIRCPLICLPPVSGTADIFFLQINDLCQKGYRVISLGYPAYWTLREFIHGFLRLLDHLHLDKVHVLGASIGGFLIQKFAESIIQCQRVQSIILCNSFGDTAIFNHTDSASFFWMLPSVALRKMVLGDARSIHCDSKIADSVLFMTERLERLTQPELASRLTLNCVGSYIEPQRLQSISITVIDVFDRCALSLRAREELYKMYPEAKRAHLKVSLNSTQFSRASTSYSVVRTGGNFPYLSRPDEVNMHILVHLRQFLGTKYSACSKEGPTLRSDIFEVPRPPPPLTEGDEAFENLK